MTERVNANIVFHATNVHQGGGKALISALLSGIPRGVTVLAQFDRRIELTAGLLRRVMARYVSPSVIQRLMAEVWLSRNCDSQDTVLCFGNLPPLFPNCARVVVFVQNRYLVDNAGLTGFSLQTRVRIWVERFWLFGRASAVQEFVVQTPSMKGLLEKRIKGRVPVRVLPFVADPHGYDRKLRCDKPAKIGQLDFLYVASGEPHKNHLRLISAWCLLAEEGLFPSLGVTIDRKNFPDLCLWLDSRIEQSGLRVTNMGSIPQEDIAGCYAAAGAFIYPSVFESFGLPLVEARQAGLPVIASELDYVRDVIDPEQTFDPTSEVSISRAVKRHLGLAESSLALLDGAGFFKSVFGEAA